MTRTLVSALAALSLAAGALAAHDLYIKMDSYFLPPDTPVQVPIINGLFHVSENSITADRVSDASLVREGQRAAVSMEGWDAEGDTTFLPMRTGEAGTYVLGVSTLPRDLGMSADDFNVYLASDGVVDVLKQRALDGELGEEAWERYAKHVKAIFQVGDEPSGGLDVVLGYPAELVPLGNPYAMNPGDELAFRAMVDGEPVANQLVIAGGEGTHMAIPEREARTDMDGVVRFSMDHQGKWYVKFIHMVKTDEEGLDYESKWATLTFEIR